MDGWMDGIGRGGGGRGTYHLYACACAVEVAEGREGCVFDRVLHAAVAEAAFVFLVPQVLYSLDKLRGGFVSRGEFGGDGCCSAIRRVDVGISLVPGPGVGDLSDLFAYER
jgi:hypothetical protein